MMLGRRRGMSGRGTMPPDGGGVNGQKVQIGRRIDIRIIRCERSIDPQCGDGGQQPMMGRRGVRWTDRQRPGHQTGPVPRALGQQGHRGVQWIGQQRVRPVQRLVDHSRQVRLHQGEQCRWNRRISTGPHQSGQQVRQMLGGAVPTAVHVRQQLTESFGAAQQHLGQIRRPETGGRVPGREQSGQSVGPDPRRPPVLVGQAGQQRTQLGRSRPDGRDQRHRTVQTGPQRGRLLRIRRPVPGPVADLVVQQGTQR